MGLLTAEDISLLNEAHLAHVATVMSDGSPQVTPVWVDTDGERILFNTAMGRVKYRNLVRDPRVAISVVDGANPYRTLWVKGTVSFIEEGALDHINALSRKYTGSDYAHLRPAEVRVIAAVTPTSRLGMA